MSSAGTKNETRSTMPGRILSLRTLHAIAGDYSGQETHSKRESETSETMKDVSIRLSQALGGSEEFWNIRLRHTLSTNSDSESRRLSLACGNPQETGRVLFATLSKARMATKRGSPPFYTRMKGVICRSSRRLQSKVRIVWRQVSGMRGRRRTRLPGWQHRKR